MRTHLLFASIGLMALPAALGAQQVKANAQGSARVQTEAHGASEAQEHDSHAGSQGSAEAALQATIEAGLPEAPVRQIIAQGQARGASSTAIAQAAIETQSRLQTSREALKKDEQRQASDAEIIAGAEALAAGAVRADLARLRDSAPAERSLTASLQSLAELSSRGYASSEASAALAARLASGASDQAITQFTAGVTSATQLTGAAGGAAAGVGAGVGAAVDAAGSLDALGGAVNVGAGITGSLTGGL